MDMQDAPHANRAAHEPIPSGRSAYGIGTACMVVVVACPCTLLIGLVFGSIPLAPMHWGALVGGIGGGVAALLATALHPQQHARAHRLQWVLLSALIIGAVVLILVLEIGPLLNIEINCMPECVNAP